MTQGHPLPYLDAVKLEIQANRDIEMLKFSRNEIHLINSMDADYFDRLSQNGARQSEGCRAVAGLRTDVVQPGSQRANRGL